jgi:hypothetical protein
MAEGLTDGAGGRKASGPYFSRMWTWWVRRCQDTRTVCIAFAGFSSRDIAAFAKKCGVTALDGNYDPSSDPLVFCDLEQTKGYEFDTLIIIQCTDTVLPPRDAPKEEEHRAACKLYVAMTRAKRELILSFHGTASPWITAVSDSIGTALWSECEELKEEYAAGVPELLPELEPESGFQDAYKLSGKQFLYTSYALGLSTEAQQKLTEIIDGRGLVRGGSKRRMKWADVGSLLRDLSGKQIARPGRRTCRRSRTEGACASNAGLKPAAP